MNEIKRLHEILNFSAFNNQTKQVFDLINVLSNGSQEYKWICNYMDMSMATLYRVRQRANDLLWNYEITSDKGIWSIGVRK